MQPDTVRRHGARRGILAAAVLAAAALVVVYPWARRATEAGRKAECLSNIHQLANAMRLYSMDYNEYIFFGDADAFSKPLAPGQAGQTQYLKHALGKYLRDERVHPTGPPPSENVWYCPADPFARRDFSCDPRWSGSFTCQKSGIGYVAVPHSASRNPGIRALHSRLLRDYGADHIEVDHALSSYRFIPALPGEKRPADIDTVQRIYRKHWGAYGYWDIHPSNTWVFEEDLPFHFTGSDALFRNRIWGKVRAFRDGHSTFLTFWGPYVVYSSENNEPY